MIRPFHTTFIVLTVIFSIELHLLMGLLFLINEIEQVLLVDFHHLL